MADRKSADRAEIKAFRAGINRRGLPKQRGHSWCSFWGSA
jgi:hypothetical protein